MTYEDLQDRPTRAVPLVGISADKLITNQPCILVGWSVRDAGAAASLFDLYDGQDETGSIVAGGAYASGGESRSDLGGEGVWCERGLWLDVESGTLQGAVWIKR